MEKDFLTFEIKKDVIEGILKKIFKISKISDDLTTALSIALYFVVDKNDEEELLFVQKVLRGIADGSFVLDFNIYEFYKEVCE